jgi:hypothetical protein
MKRLGLFFSLFLIASMSNAQIQYGVKVGLNLSDVVINNYSNPDVEPGYEVKPGLHAGIFASADGDNNFGLSAEVLYSNKGVNALNRVNLHYVTVPILLRYHLNENWFVEIGPEIGYLVNAKSKYGNLNSIWNNKLDLGLDAGLQYQLNKLYLGLRFNAGFTSVIRSEANSLTGIKYLNRVGQLSLSIPLGKH